MQCLYIFKLGFFWMRLNPTQQVKYDSTEKNVDESCFNFERFSSVESIVNHCYQELGMFYAIWGRIPCSVYCRVFYKVYQRTNAFITLLPKEWKKLNKKLIPFIILALEIMQLALLVFSLTNLCIYTYTYISILSLVIYP